MQLLASVQNEPLQQAMLPACNSPSSPAQMGCCKNHLTAPRFLWGVMFQTKDYWCRALKLVCCSYCCCLSEKHLPSVNCHNTVHQSLTCVLLAMLKAPFLCQSFKGLSGLAGSFYEWEGREQEENIDPVVVVGQLNNPLYSHPLRARSMARLQSEDMLNDDVVCCLLGSLQLDAY